MSNPSTASRSGLLFITGAPRSGTTLVDKILWQFREVDSFSQPLPLLLVYAKRAYLKSSGYRSVTEAYPLTDQQFGNWYPEDEFESFLTKHIFEASEFAAVLTEMATYSGQLYRPSLPSELFDGWPRGTLRDFVERYFSFVPQKGNARWNAWKEVFAEEFIPWLLNGGDHVLLVVRDPRDVTASLNFGSIQTFAGSRRPILWIVRQWRKSALHALAWRSHPHFLISRYEELVADRDAEVQRWCDFMQIDQSLGVGTLVDQSGKTWSSNTSFNDNSSNWIGRHADLVPPETTRFIEAACYAEMVALGYVPSIRKDEIESIIADYPDERSTERANLSWYQWGTERRAEESERQRLLADERMDAKMFLSQPAFRQLRDSTAHSP